MRKTSKCKYGGTKKKTITIKPHKRKSYRRRDGTVVKGTMVSKHKRKDVGLPGKGPKILPKLKPGKLGKHGYSLAKAATARRRALIKSSKIGTKESKKKMLQTRRRLTILKNYTKRSQPSNYRKYNADEKWLSKRYSKKFPKK
jgi:hypothetical protein